MRRSHSARFDNRHPRYAELMGVVNAPLGDLLAPTYAQRCDACAAFGTVCDVHQVLLDDLAYCQPGTTDDETATVRMSPVVA